MAQLVALLEYLFFSIHNMRDMLELEMLFPVHWTACPVHSEPEVARGAFAPQSRPVGHRNGDFLGR